MTIPHYDSDVDPIAEYELGRLSEMVNEIATLEWRMADVVRVLRERHVPWILIGDELGISAQGAQQRYSK